MHSCCLWERAEVSSPFLPLSPRLEGPLAVPAASAARLVSRHGERLGAAQRETDPRLKHLHFSAPSVSPACSSDAPPVIGL